MTEKDFIVRAAVVDDANGIAQIHVDAWRNTYGTIIPKQTLNGLSYEQRSSFWHSQIRELDVPEFILVAEDPSYGLVGFASGGLNRDKDEQFEGELYAIYLREHYHRRGIGRSLFNNACRHLQDQGLSSMIVWVLEDNPFRAFYESLAGKYVAQRMIDIGNAELSEIAYGWEDLSDLFCESTRT